MRSQARQPGVLPAEREKGAVRQRRHRVRCLVYPRTKEPGTDLFARRFHQAGFAVLAFDYRHLDESGGQPARSRGSASSWPAGTA